jgi:hypothetical protein
VVNSFEVCDAGGATVDLISYQVDSLTPFTISECSLGTTGSCGSIFLDRAFEKAIRERLGVHADAVLKPRARAEMLRNFCNFLKVEFKDDEGVPTVDIAVPGAPDIPEANLEAGFMTMSRYIIPSLHIACSLFWFDVLVGREEIRDIFLPVFYRVLDLIKDQIRRVNEKFGPGSLKVPPTQLA